jgi:hypothetical protein
MPADDPTGIDNNAPELAFAESQLAGPFFVYVN